MNISAAQVKELRERTGAGMMECKKALVETGGDMEAAVEYLRKNNQVKADKKASRIAAEGRVAVAVEGAKGAIVEVNCETDFVAREADFAAFVDRLAALVLAHGPANTQALNALKLGDETVEEARRALIVRIGEKISVRRAATLEASSALGVYVHTDAKIASLVALAGGDAELAKDLAMHVAWSNPAHLSSDDVPSEFITKEREFLREQALGEGKPPEIVEKMVEGRLRKQLGEITLLGQGFVKDPDTSVAKLIGAAGARIEGYLRFEVGEGIEKNNDGGSFVDEVLAQARGG